MLLLYIMLDNRDIILKAKKAFSIVKSFNLKAPEQFSSEHGASKEE